MNARLEVGSPRNTMVTLTLPALNVDPASSGDARDWLPSADALVDACVTHPPSPPGLEALLASSGAPALDMLITPLSARAALLGLSTGLPFYHHELRLRVPMPEGLGPEVEVWGEGTVPVWKDGVLSEPKYFSFCQDAPTFAFNPNHRRKWRPHEMLHAAAGVFWSPSMSRFECYVGARANELLPVVHWYGFDELLRPRCPRHRGARLYREFCTDCEALALPWDAPSPHRLDPASSRAFAQRGLDHYADEWRALQREAETGRPVSTPRPRLDASSDAIGYLRGHWNRLTSWSHGSWVERCCTDGVDYVSNLHLYLERCARLAQRLTSGEVDLDPETYARLRTRRVLQDVARRAWLCLEHLEEGGEGAARAEAALTPALDRIGALCTHLLEPGADLDVAHSATQALLEAARDVGLDGLTPDSVPPLDALGFPGSPLEDAARHVAEGLETALPRAAERLDLDALAEPFARSERFLHEHGVLAQRFARWYAERPDADPVDAAWVRLDAWLATPPARDMEADDFATLPEGLDALERGTLRLHTTLRRGAFPAPIVQAMTGESREGDAVPLTAIRTGGEWRLLVEGEAGAQILDAIEAGEGLPLSPDLDALSQLLDNGFLVWLPRPAPRPTP